MAGYLAKLMGLPIDRIVCATNANDIVHRTLTHGDMRMTANLQVLLSYHRNHVDELGHVSL